MKVTGEEELPRERTVENFGKSFYSLTGFGEVGVFK